MSRKSGKKIIKWVMIVILCLSSHSILSASAQTDEDEITVSFSSDQEQLTVGDRIHLTLRVQYPEGYQIELPELEKTWGDFEIFNSIPSKIEQKDGLNQASITYEATIFMTGAYETPPLILHGSDPQGNAIEKEVPSVSITVSSVLTPEDTTLREIKPQADMHLPFPWHWIALGLILLAILIWLLKKYKPRMVRKAKPEPVIVDLRPAHQIALEELSQIEARNLPQKGEIIEHYSLVSDCMRRYLEKRLDIHVLDRTTFEVKSILKTTSLQREQAGRFIDLLLESDLVKFARFMPDKTKVETLIMRAKQIVEDTIPEAPADKSMESDKLPGSDL